MRNLVLQMGISIDGYVSGGPEEDIGGGEAEHPDVVARKLAWVTHAGLHAMGRVTYEGMSGFWPTSTEEYAKPMNGRARRRDHRLRRVHARPGPYAREPGRRVPPRDAPRRPRHPVAASTMQAGDT